jgi:outer membrane protein OmpA-like peptidoglycan-associated protein
MKRDTRQVLSSVLAAIILFSASGCTFSSQTTAPAPEVAVTTNEPALEPAPAAPPAAPAQTAPVPFDEAIVNAATALFSQARLPINNDQGDGKYTLVIDPLVDGVSGVQSKATRSIESRMIELARANYPRFSVEPFSPANARKLPVVLIGTLTAINNKGEANKEHEAYRICLALADLKSGSVVAKGTARAQIDSIDHSSTPFYRDSPAWMKDEIFDAYVKTCQSAEVTDPIPPIYANAIAANALISEAIGAYDNGRYRTAADLYSKALEMDGGQQLRVYNGLYLANLKLGRKQAANQAFGKIIEHGFTNKRLALKFVFKPGTTSFLPDRQVSGSYPYWLKEIARRTARSNSCLEITGHSSPTGPEPLNEKLSYQRAEYVKKILESEAPNLASRTIASGAGSRETLIGSGKDDVSDALDRRIAFQVHSC